MIIGFEDREWSLDEGSLRLRQAEAIQEFTGLSVADWEDTLNSWRDQDGKIRNPPKEWARSVAALYWLMLSQNGEQVLIADVDPDITGFMGAYLKGLKAELGRPEPEPDPTSPPRSPKGGQSSGKRSAPKAQRPPGRQEKEEPSTAS